MKVSIALILVGPLVIAGASPVAGQPVRDDAVIQTAATGDSTASKETYRQLADQDMHDWTRKLHDFTELWRAKGRRQVDAAEARLHIAWTDTEQEAHKLQVASAEGWDNAKTGYERSSRELSEAWEKARRKAAE